MFHYTQTMDRILKEEEDSLNGKLPYTGLDNTSNLDTTKRKQYLKEQLRESNLKYSEFFENVLQKHDDVESYAKSLRKYIK